MSGQHVAASAAAEPQRLDPLQLEPQHFAARLVAWQRCHGRHGLPWQASTDPYRVWLSEIMLQQTQVSVVLAYYPRFLQRFPTVQALAEASEDEVLAQWSGLGYYRRARNLHRCAQQICHEHGGVFPRTAQGLQQLAGIGRSTAAAIAAFCFGERAAILDGNVKRVLGRSHALPAPASAAAELRALWNLAERLLPEHDIQAYTQGLMDLGATVCKPRNPSCLQCPFEGDCRARQSGSGATPLFDATDGSSAQQQARDAPVKPAKTRRTQTWVLLWAENARADTASIWLERRGAAGIWPGLWCLPQFDSREQALRHAAQLGALTEHSPRPITRHALTHLDLQLEPLQVRITPTPGAREAGGNWFTLPAALALGLPAPVRKLLQTAANLAKPQDAQAVAPT
uniref:Adenine DNA glycosylase n=1 Tax=mine drainage metagenome TaxID=410659 RepID=E6PTL1_9ZZZZ